MFTITQLVYLVANAIALALQLLRLFARPRSSLVAENLFLRKQLAFYQERQARPRRLTNPARFTLATLSQFFDWRAALGSLHPGNLVPILQLESRHRHRQARHPCPLTSQGLQDLLEPQVPTWSTTLAERSPTVNCRDGQEQPNLGQARIANELSLKLGILVSPRTVRAYWPRTLHPSRRTSSTNWQTFVRNHAKAILACDFLIAVTAHFRILYVFLVRAATR